MDTINAVIILKHLRRELKGNRNEQMYINALDVAISVMEGKR